MCGRPNAPTVGMPPNIAVPLASVPSMLAAETVPPVSKIVLQGRIGDACAVFSVTKRPPSRLHVGYAHPPVLGMLCGFAPSVPTRHTWIPLFAVAPPLKAMLPVFQQKSGLVWAGGSEEPLRNGTGFGTPKSEIPYSTVGSLGYVRSKITIKSLPGSPIAGR